MFVRVKEGEKPRMINQIFQTRLFLILILIAGLLGIVYAEEEKKSEIVKVETKEVYGELISRKPMRNPKYIGVACRDFDAYFKLDKDVRIVHKSSLDKIELGDTVAVIYDEITEITAKGREQTTRIVKTIKFVRQGRGDYPSRIAPGETKKSKKRSKPKILRSGY